jgi:hypothetical protein
MKGAPIVNTRILLAPHFSSFPAKSKLVARKQGRCAEKASAQLLRISDHGFRIFLFSFFNLHSAIYNPQFGGGRIGRQLAVESYRPGAPTKE